jgi:hypothetical protein
MQVNASRDETEAKALSQEQEVPVVDLAVPKIFKSKAEGERSPIP